MSISNFSYLLAKSQRQKSPMCLSLRDYLSNWSVARNNQLYHGIRAQAYITVANARRSAVVYHCLAMFKPTQTRYAMHDSTRRPVCLKINQDVHYQTATTDSAISTAYVPPTNTPHHIHHNSYHLRTHTHHITYITIKRRDGLPKIFHISRVLTKLC